MRRTVNRDVTREGMAALMERLGPAGAVRFIAGLGGERGRDSVKLVRELREGLTLEEILQKAKARRKRGRR
jgi:hypothetical protein